jgi:hypothetical protein
MRVRIHMYAWLAVLLAALSVCPGCPRAPKLPPDPGLLTEDFGLDLTLGMDIETAKQAAGKHKDCEVKVVTREEMNQQEPYDTEQNPQDLILVICSEPFTSEGSAPAAAGTETVSDIRCYLGEADKSVVTIGGELAAQLTEATAIERYGEPEQRTATGDAEVHLLYYYEVPGEPGTMLQLVLSFNEGSRCFALETAKQPRFK